ncbi:hypothetical protein [Nocardioides sp. SYSU DS0663]|uniref:hypothetical protein n=1 Tax=Nocardioides sp. SYSU DS0663 TaxID=3416445 RepID=UPI003F4BD858
MTSAPSTDYRLAPSMVARLVGAALVLLAVVVLAGTGVVAATGAGLDALVVLAALGVLAVLGLAWWLRTGLAVVRFDADGYRVRLVRGAGVRSAGWKQVKEAATASPRGIPCVVLKLADGGTTTIPVEVLAVDREEFVRQLQQRLRDAEGLRPL